MKQLLPLAKASNYIPFGERYRLSGNKYLALPGAITDDPKLGAEKYNNSLINHYLVDREPVKFRIKNTFMRFRENKRVINVKRFIASGKPYSLDSLSQTERYLFVQYLMVTSQ